MDITFGGGTSARKGWTVGISSAGIILWYVSSYPSSHMSSDGPSCSAMLRDTTGATGDAGCYVLAEPACNNTLGAISRHHDRTPPLVVLRFALIGTLAVLSYVVIHAINAIEHWRRGCFPIARRWLSRQGIPTRAD